VFRRLFWLTVGVALGFGASFWLMRFVRTTIERYSPGTVSGNVAEGIERFREDLKAAVAEGRTAMRDREAELRAELESRRSR
jgi:hypothetical protein